MHERMERACGAKRRRDLRDFGLAAEAAGRTQAIVRLLSATSGRSGTSVSGKATTPHMQLRDTILVALPTLLATLLDKSPEFHRISLIAHGPTLLLRPAL